MTTCVQDVRGDSAQDGTRQYIVSQGSVSCPLCSSWEQADDFKALGHILESIFENKRTPLKLNSNAPILGTTS